MLQVQLLGEPVLPLLHGVPVLLQLVPLLHGVPVLLQLWLLLPLLLVPRRCIWCLICTVA